MTDPTQPCTPWNPSRTATARAMQQPTLPIPTHCPYCDSDVTCTTNDIVYGSRYGDWPYLYLCMNGQCGAYVGLHPGTAIPLGTLANKETREARKRAKEAFTNSWYPDFCAHLHRLVQQREKVRGKKPPKPDKQRLLNRARSNAYTWLAEQLGIARDDCHIAWFDADTCDRVVQVCIHAEVLQVQANNQRLRRKLRREVRSMERDYTEDLHFDALHLGTENDYH